MQIYLNPVMVADQRSFVHATATTHVMAGHENTIFGYVIDVFKGGTNFFQVIHVCHTRSSRHSL